MTFDEFQFIFQPATVLEQLAPVSATYETGAFTGSGVGDVTAAVTAVDINLVLPRDTTSGCEAGDFAGFDGGGTSRSSSGGPARSPSRLSMRRQQARAP